MLCEIPFFVAFGKDEERKKKVLLKNLEQNSQACSHKEIGRRAFEGRQSIRDSGRIETANAFPTLSRNDLSRMELAVVAIHDSETDTYSSYSKEELGQLWPIIETADVLIGYNSNSFDIPL